MTEPYAIITKLNSELRNFSFSIAFGHILIKWPFMTNMALRCTFNTLLTCALPFLFLHMGYLQGQSKTENVKPSIFEALTTVEASKMSISLDLTLLNNARASNAYQPAIFTDSNGKKWKVEVKTRGKFRRKNAFFPPIKMKFNKKELTEQGFSSHNDIKISLPYYEGAQGDDLVIREYLAYKMYEHLTPISLRARLVRLTISDSHVESWKHEVFTLFMEDDDELCTRLGTTEETIYGIDPDSLLSQQSALMSAFNYFIGNTDWEISGIRNVKLLRSKQGGKLIVLPYDFDFSGVVNAPYSKPGNMSGLKTTKQRFLMADGVSTQDLRRSFIVLKKQEQPLLKIIENKYLKNSSRKEIAAYLMDFYDNLTPEGIVNKNNTGKTPLID